MNRKTRTLAVLGLVLFAFSQTASAASLGVWLRETLNAGDLDTSFGNEGFVTADVTSGEADRDPKIAIQSDEKIVIAGECGDNEVFCVLRYNEDGNLDRSFGAPNGYVRTDISFDDDSVRDVAIQSDGKIVVIGDCDDPQAICIARYNTDGSLDSANFAVPDGFAVFDYVFDDEAESLAIQPDGKILVAGECDSDERLCIGRIEADGDSLDIANFNSPDGFVSIDITGDEDENPEIALFADGSMVIAATCDDFRVFCLAKYKSDGSLDTSFGSPNGYVIHDITVGDDFPVAIAALAGGKILIAGSCNSGDYICVARFTKTGQLDTSFAEPRGYVLTQLLDDYTAARGMALQSNGRIVVPGECRFPTQHFCLVRYTIDGRLDTSFSDDGFVIEDIGPGEDEGEDVALQGDKIVVVGECNGNDELCLARYYGEGTESTTWHKTGVSGGLYKEFGIWISIPPGAIPSNSQSDQDECRLVFEQAGTAQDYGIELRSYVYEIRIKCNNQLMRQLLLPIEICIPPKHSDENEFGQLFHRHDGSTGFEAVTLTNSREGYVCGESSRLSLFMIGAATLPNTGFAPGVISWIEYEEEVVTYSETGIQLKIPSLDLSVNILGVPRGPEGWDVSWLGQSVGHLEGSHYPSTDGNSVLTAHVWDADGTPGPFIKLKTLSYGEQILVKAFGATYVYEVRTVSRQSPGDAEFLADTEVGYLTLITCESFDTESGDYAHRRVVHAVLVEVR